MTQLSNTSIFGDYSQAENRCTVALLKIIERGGIELIKTLSEDLNLGLSMPGLNFISQVKSNNHSVYDGSIQSTDKFSIHIESKLNKNAINVEQLKKHNTKETLLYITPDEKKPQILIDTNTSWISWEALFEVLSKYGEKNNNELYSFLLYEFEIFLTNKKLITNDNFNIDKDTVLIVAGREALAAAKKLKLYIFQNHRKIKPCRYIAFFKDNTISSYFEIIKLEKNVDLNEHSQKAEILKYHPNERFEESRNIIELNNEIELQNNIINVSIDKNGNPCPFTYGQFRYTTLTQLKNAQTTKQL